MDGGREGERPGRHRSTSRTGGRERERPGRHRRERDQGDTEAPAELAFSRVHMKTVAECHAQVTCLGFRVPGLGLG
jgi:hypothetical protein